MFVNVPSSNLVWKQQKQPSRGVLRKMSSENKQQIYRRNPMPKCDFIKAALQLFWNHFSACVFSCKLAANFQNTTVSLSCMREIWFPWHVPGLKTLAQQKIGKFAKFLGQEFLILVCFRTLLNKQLRKTFLIFHIATKWLLIKFVCFSPATYNWHNSHTFFISYEVFNFPQALH